MSQSPRVSLVVTPHKGIRYFFGRLSLLAGQTDYTDQGQIEKLKALFDEVAILLEEHAATEDRYILPALESRVPGSAAHDEADHRILHQLQNDLTAKLRALLTPGLKENEARSLGHAFYLGLGRLHAAHLDHMLEEETVTQEMMWEHFTDEELLVIQGQVIRSIPPETMLVWMKYILPAQQPEERLALLNGMKVNAPAPHFQRVLVVAAEHLPASDYQWLAARLGMPAAA